MSEYGRRRFLQLTAAALAAGAEARSLPASPRAKEKAGLRLGLIVAAGEDPAGAMQKVHDLGLPTMQLGTEDLSDEQLARVQAAVKKFGIEITALNTAGPGPAVWDFYQGPETIGLVPRQYRQARIEHLKRASDFAKKAEIPALHTHFGFIPENPNNPLYGETVTAIREVAAHLKSNGQMLLYETGQETPVTMLRCITDVGLDNQFVNLDTANLILYGMGNPVDALDVFGKLVRGMHAKDGFFPTDPRHLGREVPIGQGKVDFPLLFKKLKALGYQGPVTIEREISGPKQIADIHKEIVYLQKLIA
jgi:L-ribulose-5-phosphate 3-epimerase